MRARFDDLADPAFGFRLEGFQGEITAWHPDEVAAAIAAVEVSARGGLWAAGFVSYEAAPGLDPALAVGPPPAGIPLVWFGLFQQKLAVDPPGPTAGADPTMAWIPDVDAVTYRDRVDRVRRHIAAGDTYQLNLTNRWRARPLDDPWPLYQRLVGAQRPSYAALIDTGRQVVISASPELFFHWRDAVVSCRPMKGTAARGRWAEEDVAAGAALASSAKDLAENVMIVDLIRNDLGRVAEYGTVTVTDLFRLERYPTIWQLTSGITARTRPGTTLVDVFRALFPCGSVTGAPKRRTMELITAVEDGGRGVYCGAVGFVGPGEARFNVAIRTAVVDRASGEAIFGGGGGIVWDSRPDREFAESTTKAAILSAPADDFDLIETMAVVAGELRNRQRHLARLASSAAYFGYPYCASTIDTALNEAVAAHADPARARLSLSSAGRVAIDIAPLATRGAVPIPAAVRLAIDDHPVLSTDIWLFHKTTRRATYTDRRKRRPDADDSVLVNERGEVTETTIANLAVCIGGRWHTPPLDAGCLPGVERARLLEDGTLVERPITIAALRGAEHVAVVSSLRGWRRAVIVDDC